MPYYIWLFLFIVIFPVLAYTVARGRSISRTRLLGIKLGALAIPISMCFFAFFADYVGLGLDSQSIRESSNSPREHFTTLNAAQKPYVNTILVIVLLQLLLTICMALILAKVRIFALAIGLCGFHLSVIAGFFVLNVLLGEWPVS